jgi:hypothetical protein
MYLPLSHQSPPFLKKPNGQIFLGLARDQGYILKDLPPLENIRPQFYKEKPSCFKAGLLLIEHNAALLVDQKETGFIFFDTIYTTVLLVLTVHLQ